MRVVILAAAVLLAGLTPSVAAAQSVTKRLMREVVAGQHLCGADLDLESLRRGLRTNAWDPSWSTRLQP